MLRPFPLTRIRRFPDGSILGIARHTAKRYAVSAVLLGALLLRLALLFRPGLHPDEALYASWALRIADGRDPALLGVLVDKPPLFPYLLAGLFRWAGYQNPATTNLEDLVIVARLASIAVSAMSLVLLEAIARHAYGRRAALFAVALYALSPLAVRLSPSLLTDPLLVLWMLLGLWAGLSRRSWLAGVACGLAFATKQQALLLIPLILAAYAFGPRLQSDQADVRAIAGHDFKSLAQLAGGFLLVFTVVLWWDSLRWQWMPSFWERSATAYGGLALATGRDLPQRMGQWGELVGYMFGWPLLALLVLAVGIGVRRGYHRLTGMDRLLIGFLPAFLGVHMATTMPAWDRYALPLVPLLALVLGHGLASLWDAADSTVIADHRPTWPRALAGRLRPRLVAVFAATAALTIWLAGFGSSPVGDARAYDSAASLAKAVREAQPPGTILYHHWLGWHYGYYLAGAPVELRYWDTAGDLAAQAAEEPQQRQLIAFPAGRDSRDAQQDLALVGLRLQAELKVSHQDGSLSATLFRIVPADGQWNPSFAAKASSHDP